MHLKIGAGTKTLKTHDEISYPTSGESYQKSQSVSSAISFTVALPINIQYKKYSRLPAANFDEISYLGYRKNRP